MSLSKATHSFRRWRPGHYLRSSGSLFFWLATRAGLQVILILGLTRLLTAAEYGSFVAAIAVATLFTPFAGLGMYSVLVRDGARDSDRLPDLLGAALDLWWRAAMLFGLLAVIVAKVALPHTLSAFPLGALVLGEVASTSLTELIARVEQAKHRADRYGTINVGLALTRLIALVICAMAHASLENWMLAYALGSLSYAGALVIWTTHTTAIRWPERINWQMLREGRPFLLAILSLRVQSEANKPIIAHTGLAAVGNFNIAQRALDITALPLNALQEVLAPRLFASTHPLRHAALPLGFIMGVAMLEATLLWYGAPLLPRILGPGYANVSWLIRALVLIPTIQATRSVLGVALVALNRASALTSTYIVSMAVSIVLNLSLVPMQGLHGAVVAAYATEVLTSIMLAIILLRHRLMKTSQRV